MVDNKLNNKIINTIYPFLFNPNNKISVDEEILRCFKQRGILFQSKKSYKIKIYIINLIHPTIHQTKSTYYIL
jgi:ribosomal protein S25